MFRLCNLFLGMGEFPFLMIAIFLEIRVKW
jgi:hypothetical protein